MRAGVAWRGGRARGARRLGVVSACRTGEDADVRPHGAARRSRGSRGTPACLPSMPFLPASRPAARPPAPVRERLRAARAREVWPGSRRGRAPRRGERRGSDPASPALRLRSLSFASPHPGGARSGAGPRDAAVSLGCRCELSLGSGRRAGRGPRRRAGKAREGRARRRPRCPGRADRERARACVWGSREVRERAPAARPAPPFSSARARAAARPPLLTGCRHVFPLLGALVATVPSLPSRRGPAPPLSSPPPRRAHARQRARTLLFFSSLRNLDLRSDVATR